MNLLYKYASTKSSSIKFKVILLLFSMMLTTLSCKKDAGPGGKTNIRGKVYVKNYDPSFTILLSEYYEQGENVYISYGDETTVGDNVKTSHDGSFVFPFMRKGKYKIWAISKDSASSDPSATKAIIAEIEVKERKGDVYIRDIEIVK